MSWIANGNDRESVLAKVPAIAAPFNALYRSLWSQEHLPPAILELCRLRLAQLHRCDGELNRTEVEVLPSLREALAHWERSELFGAPERACLAFTEVYAMDAQALTDSHAEAVKAEFGDAGLVLLVEALGILDGMVRLALLWQLPTTGAVRKAGAA